jgi:thiamine pyrophosphokinase
MKLKKAFLLLNGDTPVKLPDLEIYNLICVTDGAYDFLKSKAIIPDIVSGDFDSIQTIPTEVQAIHTPDQNFTDFEKALKIIIDQGFEVIDIYGASGKEPDHFLGNISVALQYKTQLKITFFDNFGRYFFASPALNLDDVQHKTISLIPLPIAKNITTKGLQYELANEDLFFGGRIGTRNKALTNTIEIQFKSGDLLIYVSH